MARKMRKFSEGGALGKYNRRMADIKKDFAKDSAGKSGRALEVLEAKRAQRIADAEDDRAKRTGGDRTATRAAERAAESNLTKTRRYGAPQAVSKAPDVKLSVTESLSVPKMDSSIGKKPAVTKPVQKPVQKPADKAPAKVKRTYYVSPENRAAIDAAAKKTPVSKFDKAAFSDLKTGKNSYGAANIGKPAPAKDKAKTEDKKGTGTNRLARAADPKDTSAAASRARLGAALSYLNPFSYISDEANARFTKEQKAKGYAKGGKIKKMAKGGVTKEMPSSKAMGSMGMAKGGKAKMKPAAKGKGKGNPFAATKFGAAMMKKSADTKGRAMPKFAKGGSIDGCAVRGKTKAKRVTMARGGMAGYKKGGKTC